MITASADVSLKQISRYDLNIASGIIHTAKEHGVTDVVIGLHRKVNIVDSFFGMLAENLLKGLHREVMIAKFLMPINTIRRINIAVPPNMKLVSRSGWNISAVWEIHWGAGCISSLTKKQPRFCKFW